MSAKNRILVTGATGKVGRTFIKRLLSDPMYESWTIRALYHHRQLPSHARIEPITGSIEHIEVVQKALEDVTHVLHLATCKETPDQIMDVAVKGMFWLLETCRNSPTFQQFILIGGDAGVGHCVYPQPYPVTETHKHMAYPGCYALSKVLEEVMLEQYYIQYNLNGCCLRAPWIMEKDDFKYTLSFGADVFGGPRWGDLVGNEQAERCIQSQTVPIMIGADGLPVKRNFVHVDDLVTAILAALDNPRASQQTFNISMDEPVDYADVARYLAESRGLPALEIRTGYYSTWLDNTKAKLMLGWRPQIDLPKLIDLSWDYKRSTDDPRTIWYPG